MGHSPKNYNEDRRADDPLEIPEKSLVLGGAGLGVAFRVLAAETLHAAGSIEQFLLAGKERVALRADFYVDVALVGRTSSEMIAARALHAYFVVNGMNRCLHVRIYLNANLLIVQEGERIRQRGSD